MSFNAYVAAKSALGIVAICFCATAVLTGCAVAQSDPFKSVALKELLPSQDSVVKALNAGWAPSAAPVEQDLTGKTPPPTTGSQCSVAESTVTSGGSSLAVAVEAWTGTKNDSEALAVYRFSTEAEAMAWKSAVVDFAKYCPQEIADKDVSDHTVTYSSFSDENTKSVGFQNVTSMDGHWDLFSVRGTIGISVESQSSDADARQLMLLASDHLAALSH